MKKVLFWIAVIVCAAGFIFGASMLGAILAPRYAAKKVYDDTAKAVVTTAAPTAEPTPKPVTVIESAPVAPETAADALPMPPISVDFDALLALNPEVIGWLYCEGTPIDYPVLQGTDNDYYLHHSFDGAENGAGSIFADCYNRRDFADYNTVIYGHHMLNGSMFACLENYAEQSFYDEHPCMWLLTPTQNYRVDVFSGYVTWPNTDVYRVFEVPGSALDTYIRERVSISDFKADVEFTGDQKLVLLSTCAYHFNDARYVVHGVLTPAGQPEVSNVPEETTEEAAATGYRIPDEQTPETPPAGSEP